MVIGGRRMRAGQLTQLSACMNCATAAEIVEDVYDNFLDGVAVSRKKTKQVRPPLRSC